jgi:hypothetical protein
MNNYFSLEAVSQLTKLHPPNPTLKSAISPDRKE